MTGDEPEQVGKSPQDARLESLEERLERAQSREAARTGRPGSVDQDEKQGSRVLSLLLGGLFGGALLGWLMDGWFGTDGVMLIGGIVLGVTGAFYSIFKMAAPRA